MESLPVTGDMLSEQNNSVALSSDKLTRLSPGRKQVLPPINYNGDGGDKKATKDYLPQNLLATLTQACATFDDLGPNSKRKGKSNRRRTDNVWHHEKTREKLKHLVEQPPCHCGAGSDISYLLDAAVEKSKDTEKAVELGNVVHQKNLVPESIIPSEFHVVKHKGAASLEILDEKYTTQTECHEEHVTVFPSMKPSGRQEALQLMKTMNKLLKKAGVQNKLDHEESLTTDESSQIEKLLKLVKEEQTIYNVIFNEVIRQVSVECTERGTVLAELRKRYAFLLESVPKQVKSLHEEVLAQRALDRRLTEELSCFKTSITLLTKELHEIHAHDEEVTKQAVETEAELNEALKESEKNASLLAEYHDLYELQRRRLDYQLSKLIEERDLWAGSAHMLSLKVTEKHNLVTIRRLHLYEKAWYKVANNFAVLLGHDDEKKLQHLAGHVHKWQEITGSFNEKLVLAEKASCERLQTVECSITAWAKKFERVVTPDEGTVHPPESEYIQALFTDMKSWEETFNKECERFMGDVLLSCEDDLLQLNKCVDLWIQTASNIFRNHPTSDGGSHPQHVAMMELNTKIEKLHRDFKLRMSGENGVAKIFIQVLNNLDTWINKVNAIANGGETLFDSEWLQLADLFQVQWKEALQDVIRILSYDDNEVENEIHDEERELVSNWLQNKIDVFAVYDASQKWLTQTTTAIENEDSNIVEQVVTTHSNMVRWTITLLLRIAPDTEPIDPPNGVIEEDMSAGLGAAIIEESKSEAIINRALLLFNWLRSLTDRIVSCLNGVMGQNKSLKAEEQEKTQEDLRNMEAECIGWMNTANLLIAEVTGENIPIDDFLAHVAIEEAGASDGGKSAPPTSTNASRGQKESKGLVEKDEEMTDGVEEMKGEDGLPGQTFAEPIDMHIIGHDDNVKKRRMMSTSEQSSQDSGDGSAQREGSDQSVTYEELRTMELLQQQLMETEKRAQSAEEKAFLAESALKEAEEKIRFLERYVQKIENVDSLKTNTNEVSETKPPEINISTIITSSPHPTNQSSNQSSPLGEPGRMSAHQAGSADERNDKSMPIIKVGDSAEMENDVSASVEIKEADALENSLNDSKKAPGVTIDVERMSTAATSSSCSISPTLVPSPDDPPV